MRKTFAACAWLDIVFLLGRLARGEEVREPELHHATLKNGIRVELHPIPETDRTAFKLSYRVTYRDEPIGREGIRMSVVASIVQAKNPKDPVPEVRRLGGWWDPTNFYPETSAQDFILQVGKREEGIGLIAQMFRSAESEEIGKSYFQHQLPQTVRFMSLQRVPSLLDQVGFAEPFAANHKQNGVRETIGAVTQKEYLAFRRRNFVPARAVVTVAGKFLPREMFDALRAALEGFENPKDAIREPNELREFRPGIRRVAEKPLVIGGKETTLLAAYPVPPEVPAVTARLVGAFLQEGLQDRFGPESFRVETDRRPGQRLMRVIAFEEDVVEAYGHLQGEAKNLRTETLEETLVRQGADLFLEGFRKKMGSLYWRTWELGLEWTELRWNWSSPWTELERLETMEAETLQEAAEKILAPQHLLLVVQGETEEKAKGREQRLREAVSTEFMEKIVWHTGPASFPDNPPVKNKKNR